MKTSIRGAAAVALAAALAAPAFAQRTDNTRSPEMQQQSGAKPGASLSDGEIVAVLDAANQGELDLAQVALEKGEARSSEFARQMQQDHGQAKDKLSGLGIRPVGGEMSRRIKDRTRSTVTRLKGMDGESF